MHLPQSPGMPFLAREPGARVSIHQFNRCLRADDAPTQNQNVHVVMFHSLMRRVHVMTQTRPDPFHLVGRNGSANPGPADQNTPLAAIGKHRMTKFFRVVRVVDGIRAVSTHVHNLVTAFFQMFHKALLQIQPCMIRTDCQFHYWMPCGQYPPGPE